MKTVIGIVLHAWSHANDRLGTEIHSRELNFNNSDPLMARPLDGPRGGNPAFEKSNGSYLVTQIVFSDHAFAVHLETRARMMASYGLLAFALMAALHIKIAIDLGYLVVASEIAIVTIIALLTYALGTRYPSRSPLYRHFVLCLTTAHIWAAILIAEGAPAFGNAGAAHWWFVPIAVASLMHPL